MTTDTHLPAATSPAAPSQQSPPPLAALDAAGTATVISYQVPEPTSYEGRHIIALSDYLMGDFADVVASGTAPAGAVPPANASIPPVSVPRSVVLTDSSVAANAVISLSPFDLAPRLAALTWGQVQAATAAGKHVEVFRSIGGLLDYRVRDLSQADPAGQPGGVTPAPAQPVAVASKAPLSELAALPALRPVNGGDGGGPGPRPYLILGITAPTAGSPPVPGPWFGVTVPITGTLTAVLAGVVTIRAALLDGTGATVASADAQLSGNSWSAGLPVTASGSYKVAVTATSTGGLTAAIGHPPAGPVVLLRFLRPPHALPRPRNPTARQSRPQRRRRRRTLRRIRPLPRHALRHAAKSPLSPGKSSPHLPSIDPKSHLLANPPLRQIAALSSAQRYGQSVLFDPDQIAHLLQRFQPQNLIELFYEKLATQLIPSNPPPPPIASPISPRICWQKSIRAPCSTPWRSVPHSWTTIWSVAAESRHHRNDPRRPQAPSYARPSPPISPFVFTRPKMGFAVPIGDWLRTTLRPMMQDLLTATIPSPQPISAKKRSLNLAKDHFSRRADHSQRLYALMMLELWHKSSALNGKM